MANTKTLLVFILLLAALAILIVHVTAARRHKITWVEDLDRRITPLALDEIVGAPDRETPRPVVSTPRADGDAYDAVPAVFDASAEKEAQRDDEIIHSRLDLERVLDSLPETGRMGKSYFMRLAGDMNDCCLKLRSPDPELRREGELTCHRLARRMVEDRSSCGGEALEAMDRCMSVFAERVRETCLRLKFQPSPENTAFTQWAAGRMENGDKNVRLFLIGLLGIMGDKGSVEMLSGYRRSADPGIRNAAIWAMGMQGSPDVVDDIGKIVSNGSLPASEEEAFLAALGRIGDRRAAGVLYGVMRDAPPLPAYDAYLSLRELRGRAGQPLSLEEFVLGRTAVVGECETWLKKWGGRSE